MHQIKKAADQIFNEIVTIRRDIHCHPEIGRTEVRTSSVIRDKLEEYGVDYFEQPSPTAVIGIIEGKKGHGKCIALRADIDALPIQEETGLPFASKTSGVMHACGHDMHASMLLGASKILCGMRDQFCGTVKLIFQPSEDTLPGGAKELVEKGVMERPHVDAIVGMHVYPDQSRVGNLLFHNGPLTTSVDLYDVTVKGKGGHGSAPHTTHDPILAACQMVTLLQQIPAHYVDPLETVIFPVCSIHSGDAPNIIPDEAKFSGIARAYVDSVRQAVHNQVDQITRGVEALSGCKIKVDHYEGYPACYNDPELTNIARRAVGATLGAENVIEIDHPLSFSEDFSYYTKMTGTPGAYMILCAGHEGELVSLHNPKCSLKEAAMPYGVAALVSTAVEYLNN